MSGKEAKKKAKKKAGKKRVRPMRGPSDSDILKQFKSYFADKPVGMPTIAERLHIGQAEFRRRLRQIYKKRGILIRPLEDKTASDRLSTDWPGVTYHVLNAENERFYESAAEVFLEELADMLRKRKKDRPLRIGCVSGRTTGGLVDCVCGMRTWRDLISSSLFPREICVYALNPSQTDGYDHLKGNSNILAWQLAHRLRSEVKGKVEAYGLPAGLLETEENIQAWHCKPEIKKILQYTDPERLSESLEAQGKPEDATLPSTSQLDIVITGVGSVKGSLFRDYSRASGLDIDSSERFAGDIAYSPVTRTGDPCVLRDKTGHPWEFFCAVSLKVLQQMSSDPFKRVIVVARSTSKISKTNIIHAAIWHRDKDDGFCNVLITDYETGNDLHTRLGPTGDS